MIPRGTPFARKSGRCVQASVLHWLLGKLNQVGCHSEQPRQFMSEKPFRHKLRNDAEFIFEILLIFLMCLLSSSRTSPRPGGGDTGVRSTMCSPRPGMTQGRRMMAFVGRCERTVATMAARRVPAHSRRSTVKASRATVMAAAVPTGPARNGPARRSRKTLFGPVQGGASPPCDACK